MIGVFVLTKTAMQDIKKKTTDKKPNLCGLYLNAQIVRMFDKLVEIILQL